MASSKTEKAPAHTVSPEDEPSAEWGWHGSFPVGMRVGGWFTAAAMFFYLIGNHTGRTEDLWLIGIGVGLVILLVIDQVRRRTSWRR
ncbi:DUF2631 domain-containing protein [Actinosynnema sp. ALI-1.44]|uniref:DUF2631 domain-containing protein n=1 Tax=Actinosynnema sp. ALI-1.44 TaxID=1933779 RepID=UPI001EDB4F14|nr:DUF2631 domain-containing protein [Actinosynnema sp. ALI-1.44]